MLSQKSKHCYRTGRKRQKDNCSIFTRPPPPGLPSLKKPCPSLPWTVGIYLLGGSLESLWFLQGVLLKHRGLLGLRVVLMMNTDGDSLYDVVTQMINDDDVGPSCCNSLLQLEPQMSVEIPFVDTPARFTSR